MSWDARQKALYFRGLAVLLNSGVHIFEGLQSLARQTEAPEVLNSLQRIAGRVCQGLPLHKAMDAERVFTPLETGLTRVGETSGSLHSVLHRLADLSEGGDTLRRKLTSALVYPAFVLALAITLLVFAPVFVFADLLELFRQLKTELPLPTRIFLGFSDLILSPVFYLVGLIAVGAMISWVRSLHSNRARRLALEEFLFQLPAIGPALKNALAAEVSQAISACYLAGVPILRAIALGREVTWSILFAQRLETAATELQNGRSLAEALEGTEFYTPLSLTILAGGEEVGMIGEALAQVEKTTREATEHSLESMQKMLEPILLLLIGLVVGFIAIATLAPTLKVVQGL